MNNTHIIRNVLIGILLLLSDGIIKAQEYSADNYISETLKYIAERLYTDYQIDCNVSAINEVDGLAITIKKDPSKKISHIGFKLFSNEMIDKYPSPTYKFIECYLLNLYLLKEDSAIISQMNEDKVQFDFGNMVRKGRMQKRLANIVPLLSKSQSFVINTENSTYTVAYKSGKDKLFEIRFPADYQLLSGMNKKECEQSFYMSLLSFPDGGCDTGITDIQSLEKTGENSYVQRGETYQIDAMNTNRYYTSQAGTYEQLADTARAEESIHNLFTLQADKRIEADITLRLYGQKKIDFSMPLRKLLEFCKADGCKIFAGIESADTSLVKGTAILLNREHGYSHTLSFETDPRILKCPEEYKMKVNLYTFAPIHNIESIFFEKKQ